MSAFRNSQLLVDVSLRSCPCDPPPLASATFDAGVVLRSPTGATKTVPSATVCRGCGTVADPAGGYSVAAGDLRRLNARLSVGSVGSAGAFGLGDWTDVGRVVGPRTLIIPSEPKWRVDDWRRLDRPILEATLMRRLGLPPSRDTVSVPSLPGLKPVMMHAGAALKFAEKQDDSHIRHAGLIPHLVANPGEVWMIRWQSVLVAHYLGRFSLGGTVRTFLVAADWNTGALVTGYELRDRQVEARRAGLLVACAWAN